MKLSTLATLTAVGSAAAGGVTSAIPPSASPPAGCSASYNGQFEITVVEVQNAKRDYALASRDACSGEGILVLTLADGVLTDSKSRTGYIASNYQFQFDEPPQAGAIYTAGFSVCGNGSLALGGSAVFYKCLSGSFYNLYDRSWAAQCSPVELAVMACGGADPPGQAGQNGDGQVVGTAVVQTTIVSALGDGQPQVITTQVPVPICQINDGQAQAHTTPCASIPPASLTSAAPVSQYSDGQIQVTPGSGSAAPPPATTAAPPPTTSAPASGGSGGSGSSAGPGGSGSPGSSSASAGSGTSGGSNSTLATTAQPSASASQSAAAASSSKPASASAAGRVEMASVAALVIGIVGALFFL